MSNCNQDREPTAFDLWVYDHIGKPILKMLIPPIKLLTRLIRKIADATD